MDSKGVLTKEEKKQAEILGRHPAYNQGPQVNPNMWEQVRDFFERSARGAVREMRFKNWTN